jgi:hypothetical protein
MVDYCFNSHDASLAAASPTIFASPAAMMAWRAAAAVSASIPAAAAAAEAGVLEALAAEAALLAAAN